MLFKLGFEFFCGVLLVGLLGIGKILIVKVIVEELGLNYIVINGLEVMSKYYGEVEVKLWEIFVKVKKFVFCLVFIDEIDSIVLDCSKVEGEVEKWLVV